VLDRAREPALVHAARAAGEISVREVVQGEPSAIAIRSRF
jgi:hypothetical protein